MASAPENRIASTTVERIQLFGEWLEYLSGAQGGAKGFVVFRSPADRYVQFAFDTTDERVRVEVGTFEWQKELGGAIPAGAEKRLLGKDFNAPDQEHVNHWQDIDRLRSDALSSMAEWAFRNVFGEPADFRLSVGKFGTNQPSVQRASQHAAQHHHPPVWDVVHAVGAQDVDTVRELLRDHARDDICTGLQSLGVNARMAARDRREEYSGAGTSLGIIDIDGGPIPWVNVWKVKHPLSPRGRSRATYYTDYGVEVAYRPPNTTIKSVRRKAFVFLGQVIDAGWRDTGPEAGSGFVADILRRLGEDAQVRDAVIATGNVEIAGLLSGRWLISTKTREVPTRQAWDCYQAIARHLIEARREEPSTG